MKSGLLILMMAALTGTAFAGGADEIEVSPGSQLQQASTAPLRRIPETPVYRPVWQNSTTPSIVQAAFVPANEDDSASSNETSTGPASTEQPTTVVPAKPFLDLTDDAPEEVQATDSSDGTNEIFIRLVVWTVIILCLCVLTLLGLRRWQQRQGILPPKASQSRVLETLAIGPGRAVSLVQLGDVRAVVGTDGSGIKTIVLAPPAFDEELSEFDANASTSESPDHSPQIPFGV